MIRFEWRIVIPVIAACFGLFGCQPDLEVSLTADSSYVEGEEIGASLAIEVSNAGSAAAAGTKDAGENGYMVDVVLSADNSVPVQFAVVPSPYAFQEDMLLQGGRLSITETLAAGAAATFSATSPPLFKVTPVLWRSLPMKVAEARCARSPPCSRSAPQEPRGGGDLGPAALRAADHLCLKTLELAARKDFPATGLGGLGGTSSKASG